MFNRAYTGDATELHFTFSSSTLVAGPGACARLPAIIGSSSDSPLENDIALRKK
jgi:hypothetical protein